MSLKRRVFAQDFKQQILHEAQAGKSIAQASREDELHPRLIAAVSPLFAPVRAHFVLVSVCPRR